MTEEIICAGFGGQGIMSLGKFIADTALCEGLFVTFFPSYGAEVRGGTAHCMIVVSDKEISSPLVSICDTAIIMNQPSCERFSHSVKKGGRLVINSSL
ncbi:MAG: 2-oxoacid:acceptor oxidoreductase family protein, partial [Candidatus Omnitrophota bacterium]